MSWQHSQERVFKLYALGASIVEPFGSKTPHLRWYSLFNGVSPDDRHLAARAVVVVLSARVRPGEQRGRHRRCEECPYGDGHLCNRRLTECG